LVVADFEVALVVGIAVVGITVAIVGSSGSVGIATVVLTSLMMAGNELLVPLSVASVVGGSSISITIGVLILALVLSLVLGGLVVLTSLVVRLSLVSRDINNKYKVTHLSDFNATKDRQSTCWESSSCHQSL
jgi:hypothetical protein